MADLSTDPLLDLAMNRHQNGQFSEAESLYKQILAFDPDDADVLQLLGMLTFQTGRQEEGLQLLGRALQLNDQAPDYHCSMGILLASLDRHEPAAVEFGRAIDLKPDYVEAGWRLGNTLAALGRDDQAVAMNRKMLELRPELPREFYDLGNKMRGANRLEEAIGLFRQATVLRSDYFEAFNNLGDALFAAGRAHEAIAAMRQAATLRPDSADIHANLGNLLKDIGQIEQAIGHLRMAVALRPHDAALHSSLAMALHYDPRAEPAKILQELRSWDRMHALPLERWVQPHDNDPSPDRKLRIGYVSADFRDHVVGRNLLPLFREQDHERFEIFCYSNATHPDALTERFHQSSDHWREIAGVDDESAAKMIRADKIDILVDLSGHTAANRLLLFARKPAPIQATFGGYPGGTGLRAMDYHITDPYLDPPGLTEDHYVEKLVRLADSFWCYDPPSMAADQIAVGLLPAQKSGQVTFGCLNHSCKINQTTLALWDKVLAAVPGSKILLRIPFESLRPGILAQLKVAPQRVEFVPHQSRQEYLQTYHRIDIGLDALPYNGHTTSLDSLWMGVPVVTLIGRTSVGRAGWSQLSNIKLPELAANTEGEFVQKAVVLASDIPRLAQLRSELRAKMLASPLTNSKRFAQNIQTAFREMWNRRYPKK
jgi:protein O-GlcNAc transferase